MDEDILIVLVSGLVMLTFVGGIMARIALKPLVDSIARLMEARASREGAEVLEKRVALLEQEIQHVRSLAEGKDFDRQLRP
jgi:Zn-dependent protease with chaperone function